jgi:hypothetical protein
MRYSEAKAGRVFVVRLEDGDIIHESLERFAKEKGIHRAQVIALGALDEGSKLVVGPQEGRASPVVPCICTSPREGGKAQSQDASGPVSWSGMWSRWSSPRYWKMVPSV